MGRGATVMRLDRVSLLAAEVTPNRQLAVDQLGFRLYEQVVLDDGSEAGARMSPTIADVRGQPPGSPIPPTSRVPTLA